MKKILKIILSIVILCILIVAIGVFYITRDTNSADKIKVSSVNLTAVKDGDYVGKYAFGRWSNQVKVAVKDHKITKIDIVKDVTIPKQEVTKEIIDKVLQKQNTDVDVVSGATITSKAYLKSIENALNK